MDIPLRSFSLLHLRSVVCLFVRLASLFSFLLPFDITPPLIGEKGLASPTFRDACHGTSPEAQQVTSHDLCPAPSTQQQAGCQIRIQGMPRYR